MARIIILIAFLLCSSIKYKEAKMAITVSSKSFNHNDFIPSKHGYRGGNISPHLSWSNLPTNTKSIAIICDDPDAPSGDFVHWVIYNIPSNINELPENVPQVKEWQNGILQGINDFGKIGYGGPCPPFGVHRYFFKVYALNKVLDLKPGLRKSELLREISPYIIGEGQIMGKFKS